MKETILGLLLFFLPLFVGKGSALAFFPTTDPTAYFTENHHDGKSGDHDDRQPDGAAHML